MMIEEFSAIISIESKQGKWYRVFNVRELKENCSLTFAPNSPLFCPTGCDVHNIYGAGAHTKSGVAAMSNRVCFVVAHVE